MQSLLIVLYPRYIPELSRYIPELSRYIPELSSHISFTWHWLNLHWPGPQIFIIPYLGIFVHFDIERSSKGKFKVAYWKALSSLLKRNLYVQPIYWLIKYSYKIAFCVFVHKTANLEARKSLSIAFYFVQKNKNK